METSAGYSRKSSEMEMRTRWRPALLLLAILAPLLLAPTASSATAAVCFGNCTRCGAAFADAREPGAAPLFADLVGVACGGACYAAAARWSAVAVQHGDRAVPDGEACQALCAATAGCRVWTVGDGRCELKRGLAAQLAAVLTVPGENASAAALLTGGVTCEERFVPFLSGLARVEPEVEPDVSACAYRGKLFGSHAMGCCSDAKLLAVHATSATLALADQYGAQHETAAPVSSARRCALMCQAHVVGADGLPCAGWTLDRGACLLFSDTVAGCEPRIGSDERPDVVSGVMASCNVNASSGANSTAAQSLSGTWYVAFYIENTLYMENPFYIQKQTRASIHTQALAQAHLQVR